jgi:hypothetical protein
MAPEQARGMPVDGRADLYSLGCIAYEMLTRRQIFGGGSQADVLARQLKATPPPLHQFVDDIPPGLEAIVMRTLAKDPDDRPQTAHELIEGLATAMRDGAPQATTTRRDQPMQLRAPVRSLAWPIAACMATIVTLMTGALVAAKRGRDARNVVTGPAAIADHHATVRLKANASGADVTDEAGLHIGRPPYNVVSQGGLRTTVRSHKNRYRAPEKAESPRGRLPSLAHTIDPFSK